VAKRWSIDIRTQPAIFCPPLFCHILFPNRMTRKMSNNRKRRHTNVIPLATPRIEQATGDPLFEQPSIEDGNNSPVKAAARTREHAGGKARAKKLGKAKLSAIAKKVTRSRWKKAR
jgi:hypothetical protein